MTNAEIERVKCSLHETLLWIPLQRTSCSQGSLIGQISQNMTFRKYHLLCCRFKAMSVIDSTSSIAPWSKYDRTMSAPWYKCNCYYYHPHVTRMMIRIHVTVISMRHFLLDIAVNVKNKNRSRLVTEDAKCPSLANHHMTI